MAESTSQRQACFQTKRQSLREQPRAAEHSTAQDRAAERSTSKRWRRKGREESSPSRRAWTWPWRFTGQTTKDGLGARPDTGRGRQMGGRWRHAGRNGQGRGWAEEEDEEDDDEGERARGGREGEVWWFVVMVGRTRWHGIAKTVVCRRQASERISE